METNALDYALATILSIMNEENEIHLVIFYLCTFIIVELNYDIHNFEVFKI